MCIRKTGCATFIVRLMHKKISMLIGYYYVSLTISFLCRLHNRLTYSPFWMSLKITILYLQQSECVCVCVCVSMRAVYLVLLNLSFLRMSVCVCVCVCMLTVY